jgi:hypothetical protein
LKTGEREIIEIVCPQEVIFQLTRGTQSDLQETMKFIIALSAAAFCNIGSNGDDSDESGWSSRKFPLLETLQFPYRREG